MKKILIFILLITGSYLIYAQNENEKRIEVLIKYYTEYFDLNIPEEEKNNPQVEEVIEIIEEEQTEIPKVPKTKKSEFFCSSASEDFDKFWDTKFIDFRSLREGEDVSTFSFKDSLCSPLTRDLIITSPYGPRNKKKHYGVDFRLNEGDTVRSIFCGRVRIHKYDPKYGFVVVIRNFNESEAVYAHLSKILVYDLQEVEAGQLIGLGGNTGQSDGPHLHFELRYKGFPINPVVDNKFLKQLPVYSSRISIKM